MVNYLRHLKPAIAAVTASAVATAALPTGALATGVSRPGSDGTATARAAAPYSAADIVVKRETDRHIVPGDIGIISFSLRAPSDAQAGAVGFSVPLTGMPPGFEILKMSNGMLNECPVDRLAQRAWCPDVEMFAGGVGWVELAVNVAPNAPRDLDWSDVPVTVSMPASSAESVQDFASTRPCDDPPVPNRTDLRLDPVDESGYGRLNGRRTPICGSLAGPTRPGKVIIDFQAVGSTTWEELATITTDGYYDHFCKDFRQRINGKVRARFDGDADYPPASVEMRLPVVNAGLTGWVSKGASKKGKTVTMTATVVPSPRKVLLQWATQGSGWHTVKTVTSPANGRITLTWKPAKKGKYWLRAYLTGDHKAGSSGAWVRVQHVT
ncbi:hypothetical protein Ait01nite_084190 [Actinoplanes italicus]|uniref:Ig-like domain-containing protein n=1 Tax=Actinoplanes italicus TaxID=113567 RepID=A0A2T0JXU5_9ACTN|nr:hypothetical protein [Actinoplanes italicus]PRX12606.1 hypothetical protein CLV67_12729 [Actinoplanes italicus]GIE35374.1 hypothetical protein Ait01nite_084190 [Actinoplanes italicus]